MRIFSHSPSRRAPRSGFTLIELLIAITIFLLVSAVTIAAVQGFRTSGQTVDGAARQVQSYLSGARDRAVLTTRSATGPRARGVRFLPDTNLPATNAGGGNTLFACRAMQYVESAGTYPPTRTVQAGLSTAEMLFLAGDDPATPTEERLELIPPAAGSDGLRYPLGDLPEGPVNPPNRVLSKTERDAVSDAAMANAWRNSTVVNRVFKAGLLGERIGTTNRFLARLQLPWRDGPWVTAVILAAGNDPDSEQDTRLAGIGRVFLLTAPGVTPGEYNSYDGTRNVYEAGRRGYAFDLRVVPMAGEAVRPLPAGTAIDLHAAARFGKLPAAWYAGGGPAPVVIGGSGALDLLFDPSGQVAGGLGASGLIHLPIVSDEDLDAGSNAGPFPAGSFLPLGYVGTDPDAAPSFDSDAGVYSGRGKLGEELVVTVNTQTGTINVSSVNTFDEGGNGLADDPFLFAETGLEAN